jgi:2-C-methyl-D-erythritol 4-phosphate cytidylyltransferase
LKESKGHLTLFTSSSYTRGRALYSTYSSIKSAIVNFAQAISEEWIPEGIKVNAICPDRTATPMRVSNFGKEAAGTLLTAEEVALKTLSVIESKSTGQVFEVKMETV